MASRIPDGVWVCEQGHRWSHPPQPTVCPICGAFERVRWLNWDDVRDAIAAKKDKPDA